MMDYSIVFRELNSFLRNTASAFREARLPGELAERMEQLAGQIGEPCVVAVVGKVKAGKSSFVNAFLGADLAKAGTVETTATVNYFREGEPADPDRPVICHDVDGSARPVTHAFLDSLQTNDEATLQTAASIHHLEYLVPQERLKYGQLKQIVLVDTPGLGAVVDEHEDTTSNFFQIYQRLRERHDEETRQLGQHADAVIYVTDAVAREGDRDFLEQYNKISQGGAQTLNAIGVMAKIDTQPALIEGDDSDSLRYTIADQIARQLSKVLNTVVPVSAEIQRELARFEENATELKRLVEVMREVPEKQLDKLLDGDKFYKKPDTCAVSVEERLRVRGRAQWTAFAAIARIASRPELSEPEILERLRQLAGFQHLRTVLEKYFFERGHLLRCGRILREAEQVIEEVRHQYLREYRRRDRADEEQQERFLTFVRQSSSATPSVGVELENFILRQFRGAAKREERLQALLRQLGGQRRQLSEELGEIHLDLSALEELEKHASEFSDDEREEVRRLLGFRGLDLTSRLGDNASIERLEERQEAWRSIANLGAIRVRRSVAQRMVDRFSSIFEQLGSKHPNPAQADESS